MNYFFLIALILVSVLHLFDCFHDTEKRKLSKPFLLFLIISYYIASLSDIKLLSFWLILALITSWLGDVLLIPNGNLWFAFGGIAFMVSHFSFIITYSSSISFDRIIWWIVIIAAILYYGISGVIIYTLLPTTPKIMHFPMYFYLLCNSTMNVFALMQLMSMRNYGALVGYVGAILFFISDCTLFLVRYHKNPNLIYKRHFTVMLTYILGELLITQGILMLS